MRFNEAGQIDHLTFAGLRGGGGKGGGGGGSSGSSWNYSSTSVPDWLNNASQQAVGTAQQLSQRPFDPYTGQMVATPGADTSQAYQQVRDMQGAYNPAFQQSAAAYGGLLGQVNPLTASGVNDISNQLYGNYQQQVMNPAQGLLSGYLGNASPATAGQVGSNAMQLMSPFTGAVINPMLQVAQQQLAQQKQQIAGQAANVGAFGGSRQGVAEGVAQAQSLLGTEQNVGNLLQSGYNTALTPATQLAEQASQQGYTAADTLAKMGQAGYGAADTQAGNIANTNLQAGLTAAQQLPAQALQQQQAQQKDASLLQTIGSAQQNQQQQELNAQMGQFYEQQDWPVQNLDMLLSAVGAVPYGTTSISYGQNQQQQQQSRNIAGGILGGAATGAGIGNLIPGVGPAFGAVGGGILGAL